MQRIVIVDGGADGLELATGEVALTRT